MDSPTRPKRRVDPSVGARIATESLLAHEKFIGQVWDAHHRDDGIMAALCKAGIASFRTSLDFLTQVPADYSLPMPNVITEPPLALAEAYARRGLEIATSKVALLLPSRFLHFPATRKLFEETPIVRIYVLTRKPVHRPAPMAWYVWERGSYAQPVVRII